MQTCLILRRIADTGKIDDEAEAWMVESIRNYLRYGETPANFFQIAHLPGSRSAIARTMRNFWLSKAADALGPRTKKTPSNLAFQIHKFERVHWPRWQFKPQPPNNADECNAYLFFARKEHATLPASDEGLAKIIRQQLF